MNQEEKYTQMTTTPIPKLVCSLAVPTIISMLVTSFYNMVDSFLVMGPEITYPESWEVRNLKKRKVWQQMDFSYRFFVESLLQ